MTDQGNRLSYILINPSPDTRLELHDVVWVPSTLREVDDPLKMNTAWGGGGISITSGCVCLLYRYLIRPDPLSLVPNQGSSRKCSAGLSESHRFDTTDSTHLWGTKTLTDRQCRQTTDPDGEGTATDTWGWRGNQELIRWSGMQRLILSTFSPDWTPRCQTCMDLFSSTMNGMFYLCTYFQSIDLRDTEVHLKKNL